ncbi:FGGY-family carbohydrate kinase [Nakamurella lactea]|uniref:FGGY-family carbohydrate kinase n=1 Tax=Nakamurella lactea TaxID=459515 RepID=UPI0004222C7A|nr:FGGY-family carbohydrate kinase [Nakamurella lactea]
MSDPAGDDALYLGIDIGTQGVRAALVAADGTVVGTGASPLRSSRREAGRHEQDPDEWWRALCQASTVALAGLGGRRLGGVALDATSGTILVEDARQRPLTPALMYDDARAVEQGAAVAAAGRSVWARFGVTMQPSWALPKALWLVHGGLTHGGLTHSALTHGGFTHSGLTHGGLAHGGLAHSAALPAGARIVHQGDHLVARLAGRPTATDTSQALKTGVDLIELRWPSDVFDDLGLDVGLLPEVVLPGTVIGEVGPAAAAATAIPVGTPIRAGMTDGCAAQIASGALDPGSWSSTLGTTLVIKGSTSAPVIDPTGAVYSHRSPDGGWLPGGASGIGAGIIARDFAGADLAALSTAAAALEPAGGVCYPLAGRGERFPFVAPAATGFTEGVPAGAAARFAAVLQGIAFTERLGYQRLRELGAEVSGPVSFSGGATANDYWNQLRCDLLGLPVVVPEHADAAIGMAILAAAPPDRPGGVAATAARMVRHSRALQPDPDRAAVFDDAYAAFVAALTERGWLPGAAPHQAAAAHQTAQEDGP